MEEKKLKEFINFKNNEKFRVTSKLRFKDNSTVCYWWKNNKDDILNSKDNLCLIVKTQYEFYLDEKRNKKLKESEYSYKASMIKINLYDEFKKIEGLDKFDKDTEITLSNGMNAYMWFKENFESIINNKIHTEILNQYKIKKRIDQEKRKKEEQKKALIDIKYAYLFLALDDINKFDDYSRHRFYDGTLCHLWFIANKEKILKSDLEIYKKIKGQYKEYLHICKLKEEFIEADFEKFVPYSDIRFSSGAFMYDWFESNKNNLFNSIYKLDLKISSQYKSYLLGQKNEKKSLYK